MKKTLYFGMHRGGSSLLFMLLQRLYASSGLASVDIVADQMNKGTSVLDISQNAFRAACRNRYLIGCFRDIPGFFSEHKLDNFKNVFMIRDPRECVVSWFWAQHLHKNDKIPPQIFVNIEELIEKGDFLKGELDRVHDYLKEKDKLIVKYEDICTFPQNVVRSIVDFLGINFPRHAIDDFLLHCNTSQIVEDEASHNRSGRPGEIFGNLDQGVLEVLNERYSFYLDLYGYDRYPNIGSYSNFVDRRELDSLKRYTLELARQNSLRMQEISDLNRIISGLRDALR